jgi:hypothetical protein
MDRTFAQGIEYRILGIGQWMLHVVIMVARHLCLVSQCATPDFQFLKSQISDSDPKDPGISSPLLLQLSAFHFSSQQEPISTMENRDPCSHS